MNRILWAVLVGLFVWTSGCQKSAPEASGPTKGQPKASAEQKDEEAEIKASLAKLSPEDRKLAEEQRFCAIADSSRLGSMGTPVKIMLKDQPVFLCCKGCLKKAESNPDKTLARVKELKASNATSPEK